MATVSGSRIKSLAKTNDVKRPESVVRGFTMTPVVKNLTTEQEMAATDFYILFALIFGTAALILKVRFCAWQSLTFVCMSLANSKAKMDLSQLASTFIIASLAIIMGYFGPSANLFK
eukprot:TRINITY_DN17348_c0_g1_i1.p1 TRINITY_DN17348_c0_g1~~TRINITY_DN17348_c0_g1_i1.p1  ORF type:complete len:117 (-),score=20.05 TRINITY_DN17348_c0_g1_i1:201-551(-)